MTVHSFRAGALLAAALAMAACDSSGGDGSEAAGSPVPTATPGPPSAKTSPETPELDFEALSDRTDPERLVRYYVSAIQAGKWADAARAWTIDSEVTGETLEAAYGGGGRPRVTIGKGDFGGAAGSMFYEAPGVAEFPDGREARRGTITLRRANDVPGASEEQLNWRIERSTLLPKP